MTLLTGFLDSLRRDPSGTAVIDSSGAWDRNRFMLELEKAAAALEDDSGRGPVTLLATPDATFLATFMAVAKAGRAACTLHRDWAKPETEAAIADVAGFESPATPDEDPVFYIGFTSGTSGRPKPFARRQNSWSSSFEPAAGLFGVRAGDRFFLPGSLQHSHFLFGAIFGLDRRASVRLYERFDPGLLAEELDQTSRGVLYLVPTMLLGLDEAFSGAFDGVHSVVVSGAKMEPHHWEIARRLFPGAVIGELYGSSETSFMTVNTKGEKDSDPGYVGEPFPGVELEIRVDAESPGDTGQVFVRSPYLFEGYLKGSELESPVGDDGFMTVGDVGELTDGGLSLSGRASNMLITGGKNVHPEEVEAQLSNLPAISESVVIGAPHPHWGEELVAFVVADPGLPVPEAGSLKNELKPKIAGYKIPKRWFLVERIPRNLAGKVDRTPEKLFDGAVELGTEEPESDVLSRDDSPG